MSKQIVLDQHISVNRAFSKHASQYDADGVANRVLTDLRHQVYAHVQKFLRPEASILEINAGTGMDALHFVELGHRVHATDLSDGMIQQIKQKILKSTAPEKFSCQQVSYDQLDQIEGKFDYVFSNFGGLNCIQDLSPVIKHLRQRLNNGAYVTCVIMPPVCPWEILGVFKGRLKSAFRRLNREGVISHFEGHSFKTYYHSLNAIKVAFGNSFQFIESEGLAALSPMPHRYDFPVNRPGLYKTLCRLDKTFRHSFPFNRWADHIIVTFKYK